MPYRRSVDPPPVGLVLSGGGARGVFQVGVWEVLREHPQGLGGLPEVVSGTSAGAINGALMAAGLSAREMLDFWIGLAERPPVKANRGFFRAFENALLRLLTREPLRPIRRRARSSRVLLRVLRKHARPQRGSWLAGALEYLLTARFDAVSDLLDTISTAYLFSTERVRDRLADAIGGRALTRPRCRLAINAVDIHTGKVIRFISHPPHIHSEMDAEVYHPGPITVDMVAASAAIPLLFDPVMVQGQQLWDGGLLVNTPIAPAVSLGARRIIPVLITAERPSRTGALTLGTAVERLADAFLENAYSADRKLLLERNRLAHAVPERGLSIVELYEAIRPASHKVFNAGSYLYFEPSVLREMYEAGKAAARAWLARGPLLDTHPGPHFEGETIARVPIRSGPVGTATLTDTGDLEAV